MFQEGQRAVPQEAQVVVVAERNRIQRIGQHGRQEAVPQQDRRQKVLDTATTNAPSDVVIRDIGLEQQHELHQDAMAIACKLTIQQQEEREVGVAVHVKCIHPAVHKRLWHCT